jgi:hypothetical protein
MAGTLVISTLSDGTNSTSATNPIMGSAKAWVNFNGSSGAASIRASYNVSSVTYNSAGDFTINFSAAFSDANYAAVFGGGIGDATAGTIASMSIQQTATLSTSSCRVNTGYANSQRNNLYNCAAFFR